MQQAGLILSDDFDKRAVVGAVIIEIDQGGNFHLGRCRLLRTQAVAQHFLQIGFSGDDVVNALLEALPFGQVQFQNAKLISEIKSVDNNAGVIREGGGLPDVHAPSGENTGHIGEKERTTSCDQGELEPAAAPVGGG